MGTPSPGYAITVRVEIRSSSGAAAGLAAVSSAARALTALDVVDSHAGQRPFEQARELFEQVALAEGFVDFQTMPAYEMAAGE